MIRNKNILILRRNSIIYIKKYVDYSPLRNKLLLKREVRRLRRSSIKLEMLREKIMPRFKN